jgi:integrase
VTLTDGLGGRRDVMLGKYGTAASRQEYARVLAEWDAAGRRLVGSQRNHDVTVNEVILAFWKHAEQHYRDPDGHPTAELAKFKLSLKPLKELYGLKRAADFGPLALDAIRLRLVDADPGRRGTRLSRNEVNKRVRQIKRVFKWAVAQELVPATVYHALQAVSGLARGRTKARETEPVRPVADALVDAIRPYVMPEVWAMVELQRLTGMRPGEACVVRACDIDMSGPVWLHRPNRHKTAWRGRERVIALGPRAQAIVRPFLTLNTEAYLFSPVQALAERSASLRARRKSKVQPSQRNRRARNRRRPPSDRYTTGSYQRAIHRACDRAFPAPSELARRPGERPSAWRSRLGAGKWSELKAWQAAHRWHPSQLRHNFATMARRHYGLEAAQVVLGHSKADVTQVYAERDLTLALKVASEVG